MARRKPRLAVWKFASCDGCQLTLLDCEDELLALPALLEIARFDEVTRRRRPEPYDVSLVEGSITTQHDAERIHAVRRSSRFLVALGACAIAGGVQALRNAADTAAWVASIYPRPEELDVLPRSTPVSSHVKVDVEIHGCPPDKKVLLRALAALIRGEKPVLPAHSVCIDCKLRGVPCVVVARREPCLGPLTRCGCGAICPAMGRGCYGCHEDLPGAAPEPLQAVWQRLGRDRAALEQARRTIYGHDV